MENSATAGTIGKDGAFVPFVMMWAKSVPTSILYGPNSVFSESYGNTRIHPNDTDAESNNEGTGPDVDSSATYTFA